MSARRARAEATETSTAFPIAPRGEQGYRRADVDTFLGRARATYEGAGGEDPVTASELRRTSFPLVKAGYSARFVDAAVDRLEEIFFERERRAFVQEHGMGEWETEVRAIVADVRGRITRPRGKRFRRRGLFATGYKRSQVDAFIDRVTGLLDGSAPLSTGEVREVMFHTEWRGYDEDQVDALLDSVVELVLASR